jgi:hypothetical protein
MSSATLKFSNDSYYEQLKVTLRKVKPHGHYFSALCPIHDDHEPSLLVYPDGFKCMGCNRSGSLAQLFAATRHRNHKFSSKFLDALSPLSVYPNTPNNLSHEELAWLAHDLLTAFPGQGTYLTKRGVSGQIDSAHLGWIDGLYTFPAFDEADNFLSCPMRSSETTEKIIGLRWLPCPKTLYVPNWPLFLKATKVVIVAGIFDALTLSELGVASCTSTLGKNFDFTWLEKYRTKKFLVWFDKGEEAEARKLSIDLTWRGYEMKNFDWPEDCKDQNDLYLKGYQQCLLSAI